MTDNDINDDIEELAPPPDYFLDYLMDPDCLDLTEATTKAIIKAGFKSFEKIEATDFKTIEDLSKQLTASKVSDATAVTQSLL